jgi:hypothetical protein
MKRMRMGRGGREKDRKDLKERKRERRARWGRPDDGGESAALFLSAAGHRASGRDDRVDRNTAAKRLEGGTA